jgi:hypothetical protein
MKLFRQTVAACMWLAAAVAGPVAADPPAAVRTAQAPVAAAAGDPAAAATHALSPDPLERLRQRIEERLDASRATPTGTTREPRTVHHAAAAARAGRSVNPAPGARRGAAAGAQHGAAGAHARSALKPESAPCARDQSQTPIDIHRVLAVDLEPVR